jgi:hypothetical protein
MQRFKERLLSFRILPWVIIGLIIGVGGVQVGELWWDSLQPKKIFIQRINTEPVPDGGYRLTIYMHVPYTPQCLHLAEHMLAPTPVDISEFQPLAAILAGSGSQIIGDIRVDLKIHPYMVTKGSTWYYFYRATSSCIRFPGLVRWQRWQSDIIPIKFS